MRTLTSASRTTPAVHPGLLGHRDEQVALVGHLVLYSVFDRHVTRDDLERWFAELQLDPQFVPAKLRS
ncbi:MAG TPA: hypothetical protein VK453_02030 [Micromonosporaceae bacterium]|nr:hypothetical protein [Micromonosporaceae bacterium]